MANSPSARSSVVPEGLLDRTGFVRTALVLAGFVLAALVANVAAAMAASSVLAPETGATLRLTVLTIGTECSFLLVGAAYRWSRSSFRLPVTLPTRQTRPYLAAGLLASFLAAVLSLAITDAIFPGFELSPGYAEYSGLNAVSGLGVVVGAGLSLALIGPVEEFFFRGVIQGRLAEAVSPVSAVGLAAVVFAFFHVYPVTLLSPPPIVVAHMAAYYTIMGLIFGWVYHRTATLVVPALVHGVFNAVLFSSALWL